MLRAVFGDNERGREHRQERRVIRYHAVDKWTCAVPRFLADERWILSATTAAALFSLLSIGVGSIDRPTLRFFLLYCSDCYALIEQTAKVTKECPESTIDNFLWETQRKEEMRRKLD